MNSPVISIERVVCQVKTGSKTDGLSLLHSNWLGADNIKKVFSQVAEENAINDAVQCEKVLLTLGTLALADFNQQFNQRLAAALAEFLATLPVRPVAVNGRGAQEAENFAMEALQPHRLKQLIRQPASIIRQQLGELFEQGNLPRALAALANVKITSSTIAFAALIFVLGNRQGISWLSQHRPEHSRLRVWAEAVKSGEIPAVWVTDWVDQIMALAKSDAAAFASGTLTQMTVRWILPLWRQPAIYQTVFHHQGATAAESVNRLINPLSRQGRTKKTAEPAPASDEYNVADSGLMLLWPVLEPLFLSLELIHERQFINETARWQGVNVLKRLTDAEPQEHTRDNKIHRLLCAIPENAPQETSVTLSETQQLLIDNWLEAIAGQIPAWQKMSLADIRALFLRRVGRIDADITCTQIVVKPEPWDYLLRDWQWPLNMAYLPWLEQPLVINWQLKGVEV